MNIKVFKGKDPKILNKLEQQIYKNKINKTNTLLSIYKKPTNLEFIVKNLKK